MQSKLLLILLTLFLLGCEERYTSKVYNQSLHVKPNEQIIFTCKDTNHSQTLQKLFSKRELESNWKLLCYDSGLHGCSNPTSANKSHSEGYIRLSLFNKDKEVYRIQYNYENNKDENVLEKMIKQMFEEVGE